jgi:hypothetical protein
MTRLLGVRGKDRRLQMFLLTMVAYNLVRMRSLGQVSILTTTAIYSHKSQPHVLISCNHFAAIGCALRLPLRLLPT